MDNLKCPYCGKKISYLSAIRERANGEHACDKCRRNSTIYFVKSLKVFIVVICLVALAMLSVFLFTPLKGNFFCIFLMFIPFLLFYFCIPLFIRFVPIKLKKIQTKKTDNSEISLSDPVSASGTTKVMKTVGNERIVDPKGSADYTRMIPKIRERKRRGKYGSNDNFLDISKL
ncbi:MULTISPECIES: hypothetical protein [unclassified Ruminococcus]|uniref:hypothetical protein n=1 Tax=unclassified Ruminococcus TaxID=2608920 RepID=UPI00210A2DF2|nr:MULTISPECIES: hypothetical protein [unclassified Ruminococcus]MCQ4021966.1 hypothetical protein [Ruminococcus sp. zg-924]MCQ4114502.1 hypothetical protein [Ruminococcus sp. zg-921]